MPKAIININGKSFTLTGTETEIKQQAISLIRFPSAAAQYEFLERLVITDESLIKQTKNNEQLL